MARKNSNLFARFDLDYGDHPKIAALSDGAFRAHVEMILYSRKYLTDGRIPKRFANRFGTESVSELLSNSVDAPSLVEGADGDYWLHDFADHQETKAEVEARRLVNAENGRRGGRPATRTGKRTETQSVTQSVSDSGTQMKAETETETETDSLLRSEGPQLVSDHLPALIANTATDVAAPPKKRKTGTRIPDDWQPARTAGNIKAESEFDGETLSRELLKFRNHYTAKAGKDATRLDWNATWQNWLMKAQEFAPRKQPLTGATLADDDWTRWAAEAAAKDERNSA